MALVIISVLLKVKSQKDFDPGTDGPGSSLSGFIFSLNFLFDIPFLFTLIHINTRTSAEKGLLEILIRQSDNICALKCINEAII